MWTRQVLRDSKQLRESYLGIYNYVQGHRQIPRLRTHRVSYISSRTARCLHYSADRASNANEEHKGGDVAQGISTPTTFGLPEGFTQRPKRRRPETLQDDLQQQLQDLVVGEESNNAPKNGRIPAEAMSYIRDWKRRHYLVADTTSWDFVQFLRTPPNFDEPPLGVKLYGYVSSIRGGGKRRYLQLVDPHLRRAVQVIESSEATDPTTEFSGEQTGNHPIQSEAFGGDAAPEGTNADSKNAALQRDNQSHTVKVTKAQSLQRLKVQTPVMVSGRIIRREVGPNKTNSKLEHVVADGAGVDRGQGQSTPALGRTETRIDPSFGQIEMIPHLEIHAHDILELNSMPNMKLPGCHDNPSEERRHLQIRGDQKLRHALRLRSKAGAEARKFFFLKGFDEIETPLLFRSTPEGAREFIVPTRKKGMAYALPQSPQQYKQILMGSGVGRYFQFAKCFRDEDMRADRQPEFTQLDLEMAFARREDVMIMVERLIAQTLWPGVVGRMVFSKSLSFDPPLNRTSYPPRTRLLFPVLTYQQAMTTYGSDKPDLRLGSEIQRVEHWIPPQLQKMLSSLQDPVVEVMKIDMEGQDPATSSKFITEFLDAKASLGYMKNSAGAPGVTVFDPKKPLNGLASFGHEAAAKVEEVLEPDVGDIVVLQARADTAFTGGSTMLGNLRREIHQSAVNQKLKAPPRHDTFLWVVDFPLFSPIEGGDQTPGQGGSAGICSTHHPFTAPKLDQDLTKLFTDPLSVIGDHYDLVINGVEVGGGSRRIHEANMQELIFDHVLKIGPESKNNFAHLLQVLASGCPPHAGFALGFDRLMALMLGRSSVRDVIAFPKWGYEGSGEDRLVRSPSPISEEALRTYHLALADHEDSRLEEQKTLSLRA